MEGGEGKVGEARGWRDKERREGGEGRGGERSKSRGRGDLPYQF